MRRRVRPRLEVLEERLTPSYDVLKVSGANSFIGSAGSIAANQPSGALTVQLQDNNGNPIVAAGNRTVNLSSSSSTAQFLDLSGKPLANNSIVIPTGSSSALFEYQDGQTGNAEITADVSNTSVFGQASIDVEDVLAFITPSQVTAAKQPSGTITVQLQDGNGNPITAKSSLTVTLSSTSSTGTFLDTSGNPLPNKSITIAAGSNSSSFEYEDSQAQSFAANITASATFSQIGGVAATGSQQEYVGIVGAIVTPTQTIAPNQPSKPITIQLENAVTSDTTITLSSTSSGGQFLDTSGNPLPNNTLVIPHGSSSGSFEYEDSQTGTPFLFASSSALNLSASVSERVGASGTLAFVTLPQTLASGQASQPITVQLQSGNSGFGFGGLTNALNATSDVTVTLSSTSSGGTFLDTSGTPLPGNSITLKAGTSTAGFEYEDSQEGLPTLTVSMSGSSVSPTQTENVGGVSLAYTTQAQTIAAGQPSGTITVEVEDSNGNPITSGTTIDLSSNSGTGKFLDKSGTPLQGNSITIPAGSSTASFEYEDTAGGSPTLTATIQPGSFTSSGATITTTQQETVNGPFTIAFTTAEQTIAPNKASQPITVELRTSTGTPATTASDVTVNLNSSSNGGTFLDTSGQPLQGNSVTIAADSSSASFEYEDSQTGLPTLTASENGFTSQQVENVGVSLAFTTAPQTIAAGQTSTSITVQLQDGNGNAFAAPVAMGVSLSSSLLGVQFLDANGKPLSGSSIPLAQGASSVSFEFNSTFGGTLSLSASANSSTSFGLALQASQKETVQGPAALAFTTSPQTIAAGQTSQTVTVQLQDNTGNPVNAPNGGLTINLSGFAFSTFASSNTNVQFFDVNGNSLGTGTAAITMLGGSNTASFKFQTATAGTVSLEVSVPNGFSAFQDETVQAGAPKSVAFVTPAQSLTAGIASGSIVVQLEDQFGNAIQAGSGGVTVNLSSSSTTGQFLSESGDPLASPSITIAAGSSTAVFEYEDSQAGTPTLTATASGVNGTQQESVAATSAAIHVSNTNPSGGGSLLAAITQANANPGSTIVFDSGVTGTIALLGDLPNLQANTNIIGPGANVLTIVPSPNSLGSFGGLGIGTPASPFREFGFSTSSLQSLQPMVTVTGLTVANFKGTGITNYGFATLRQVDVSNNQAPPTTSTTFGTSFTAGGIGNTGTLTVLDSTIADNSTTNNEAAAGINSEGGSLIVINSTIAGNVDNNSNSAGGIAAIDGAASIASSTISGNTASQNTIQGENTGPGGGLEAEGTVRLYDSIVAGNTGSPANPTDVSGAFTSLGNNLIGVANSQSLGFVSSDLVGTTANPIDPKLGSLTNNGGPTPTMTLLTGSPALGAGNSADAPATDQRGDSRPQSGSIDMGSVEITTSSNSGPSITLNPTNQSAVASQKATFTASASGNPTPTVQWEVSTNGGPFVVLSDGTESNGTIVSGSGSPTLTLSNVSASLNGTAYEAVFTNTVNGTTQSATTSSATLTVTPAPTPPAITTQPTNQTATEGGTASFTAAASGSPTPTVQWEVSINGLPFAPLSDGTLPGGTIVSGSTTPTLTLSNVIIPIDPTLYEAVFSNSAGNATTNTVHLSVTAPVAPVITGNPSNQKVKEGGTATFTASASGSPTPSVQWQISTDGGAHFSPIGGNSTTLTINNVGSSFNGALVEAVFSNSAGSVTTSAATLTVQVPTPPPPPHPQPQPPALNVPPLLQLFDSLLGGVETINANGTETVTDSIFGFPLFVSTFDSHGNVVSVDLFGSIDITFLFTLFP